MPAIRPKRTFTMLDIAKDRARSRLKTKGPSQIFINLETMENDLRERGIGTLDIEMIDEHIDKLIARGLKDSIWAKKDTNESIPSTPIEETDSHACKKKAPEAHDIPPELRKVVEAEKRRAAKITANLRTCTIAINGVQMVLSTDGVDGNKEFSQGLLIYLRAAIAQFMANGPGATFRYSPPNLLKPTSEGKRKVYLTF
ncbi:putative eka-like protein [Erysiphe necator]|uniref:Putative eka-like protein n=1 Tax=Uncinula necator TaxID=52586 RepID=A0A0B1PAP1_UNCNE|nr:putative eka-like protein [Erysiphe necator]